MDNQKIVFVICCNNIQYYNECRLYISELIVPDGFTTDILCIQEATDMAEAYNAALEESDAKYKVYLHQDVYILNRNFIQDVLRIFADESVGMIGMLGWKHLQGSEQAFDFKSDWNVGKLQLRSELFVGEAFDAANQFYKVADLIDSCLMVTQYDIPWATEPASVWFGLNIIHSIEMRKRGWQVVVPSQETAWCYHDTVPKHLTEEEWMFLAQTSRQYDYPLKLVRNNDLLSAKMQQELSVLERQLENVISLNGLPGMMGLLGQFGESWILNDRMTLLNDMLNICWVESKSEDGICSEWLKIRQWDEMCSAYRSIRHTLLRIIYRREDERTSQLKEMLQNGFISPDCLLLAVNGTKDNQEVASFIENTLTDKTENPFVTIVLPTYNGANFVGETIQSVLDQTYQNFELLIIDDCSTDNTRSVIDGFTDARIKKICLDKNRHVCYAANTGFQNARGKYIFTIGHDDLWDEYKVEKQVRFMEKNDTFAVCFTWAEIIDENKNKYVNYKLFQRLFNISNQTKETWLKRLLLQGNCLCAPSACIRTATLREVGFYNYGLLMLQDFELWLRILDRYDIYILNEKLTFYRQFSQNGKNLSSLNEKTYIRTMHENAWIFYKIIMEMADEKFARIFEASSTEEMHVLCEKALLLLNQGNQYCFPMFFELLEQPECRRLLEEEYHLDLQSFYKETAKPLLSDYNV